MTISKEISHFPTQYNTTSYISIYICIYKGPEDRLKLIVRFCSWIAISWLKMRYEFITTHLNIACSLLYYRFWSFVPLLFFLLLNLVNKKYLYPKKILCLHFTLAEDFKIKTLFSMNLALACFILFFRKFFLQIW